MENKKVPVTLMVTEETQKRMQSFANSCHGNFGEIWGGIVGGIFFTYEGGEMKLRFNGNAENFE